MGWWGGSANLFFKDVVLDDAVEGAECVFHADLLAFFVGAAVVGDTYLVNADLGYTGYFGSNLRLEAKAFFFQLYVLYHITAEELVAGLHIREIEISEHIRSEGEPSVAYGMPEK